MAETLVVDSWPVLEWLKNREPAASKVKAVFDEAALGKVSFVMCWINYGEVIYTVRKAPDIADSESALRQFCAAPILLHAVYDALVDAAVDLKSKYAFAYADAFASALAIRKGAPLGTSDTEFRKLEQDGLLPLEWVGA